MSEEPTRPVAGHDPYRELFERSADAILIIDGDTFIDCNAAAVRMLRYERKEQVLATHPSELSPPFQPDGRESFEKANEMIGVAFERGSHRFEWAHKRADGEVFPVEVLLTAIQEPNRRVLHVVWRDVTERKQLEARLRQAQKMEAIGKLAGGIAHDFNNLLVVLLGNAELLADLWDGNEESLEYLDEIRRAGERAAALVHQLLAFSRKQELLPVALDLNGLVRGLRRLLERLIGEDVRLEVSLADVPIAVKADRGQLEQVLLNLATNARDAMPDGGLLRISTRRTGGESVAGTGPGDWAVLEVSDTGVGMDAEMTARAFEPFFTSKTQGHGTGLGLSLVYGIVEQSGGRVAIRSAPGKGATVEVALPVTTEEIAAETSADEPAEPTPGSGLILVVEDEASVSQLVVRALEGQGFEVLLAHDGREALSIYERHADRVALLLTDVIMPDLSGDRLVAELEARGHRPRVLFMSGYTDDRLGELLRRDDVDFLEKPFGVSRLLERVRRALATRGDC